MTLGYIASELVQVWHRASVTDLEFRALRKLSVGSDWDHPPSRDLDAGRGKSSKVTAVARRRS